MQDQTGSLSPVASHLLGATAAEMVGSAFFVPMEVVKQRQQLGIAGYGGGLWHAMRNTPRRDLYRGYMMSLASFVPYSGLYFTLYEHFVRRAGHGYVEVALRIPRPPESFFFQNIVAFAASYPSRHICRVCSCW